MEITKKMCQLKKYITNSDYRFEINSNLGKYAKMSDAIFLKKKYKIITGKELNLVEPKTFNEKLQWLKLNDRKEIYTMMADKYKMRQYVSEKLNGEYTIPLLGVWDSPDEIDFESLPDQFVLKCNHNSGLGMCICKNKKELDYNKVKKELTKGIKQDYYLAHREWPYKDIPRKIICEKYMVDDSEEGMLADYKFFCFNGKPKLMYISHDASSFPTTDFFDMEFNHIDMKMKDPNSNKKIEKPMCFEQMKQFSEKLAEGTKFLRVDYYYINNKIYVGELTFFHNAGFGKIYPEKWEDTLGKWIEL